MNQISSYLKKYIKLQKKHIENSHIEDIEKQNFERSNFFEEIKVKINSANNKNNVLDSNKQFQIILKQTQKLNDIVSRHKEAIYNKMRNLKNGTKLINGYSGQKWK